jgi:glycosyltransferase involved in cell wall biosynthesis
MKVLVVNNAAPFIRGGAEELADNLVRRLNATSGVQSELLRIPFKWEPAERLIDEMLICRQLRLYNVDRVIGLKFPAYLIPHHDKVLWLLHQFRQAYDLHEEGRGYLGDARGMEIRGAIQAADDRCFAECAAVYVNSPVTRDRMRRFNGVDPVVLYPPLNDAELFTGGEDEGYVFAGGRVAPGKRQHLLVEAMAKAPGAGRLVIGGPPESQDYADRLNALIADHGLQDRVELRLGFHPREDIARWVNGARACAYIPYDEDSLGYVTMEAVEAGKPVLTTTDAGGLLELIGSETGAVVEPTPEALAEGLAHLTEDAGRARSLGQAAREAWRSKGIDWKDTIAALLS